MGEVVLDREFLFFKEHPDFFRRVIMADGDEIPVQNELGELLALAGFLSALEEEHHRRQEKGHDLGQDIPTPARRLDQRLANDFVYPGDFGPLVNGQEERTTGFENADEFGDGAQRIGRVMDRSPSPDDVEGGVGERKMKHILLFEVGVGQPEFQFQALGRAETSRADIDSGHFPGAVTGEDDAENTRAAAGVQDGFSLHFLGRVEKTPMLL